MNKWGIVSDLVRALSNTSESGLNLHNTETENAIRDMADIMDTMITNKCSFNKALKIERENTGGFGEWIEEAIKIIKSC